MISGARLVLRRDGSTKRCMKGSSTYPLVAQDTFEIAASPPVAWTLSSLKFITLLYWDQRESSVVRSSWARSGQMAKKSSNQEIPTPAGPTKHKPHLPRPPQTNKQTPAHTLHLFHFFSPFKHGSQRREIPWHDEQMDSHEGWYYWW